MCSMHQIYITVVGECAESEAPAVANVYGQFVSLIDK